jgi:hypothetical protein
MIAADQERSWCWQIPVAESVVAQGFSSLVDKSARDRNEVAGAIVKKASALGVT